MAMEAVSEETPGRRKRRWPIRLLWVVAAFACLGGVSIVAESATFPRAVAEHPVRTQATVTQSYINGLGGDPGVSYEYRVGGRVYDGSGNGKLGGEPMPIPRGGAVAIEYAATAPSESCTCDAASEAPPSLRSAILMAAALSLPLAALLWRAARRLARTRRSWFVPVRGSEWVPFVGGIVLAAALGALFLAYLVAPAVEKWGG
jgi:hypothetical protein